MGNYSPTHDQGPVLWEHPSDSYTARGSGRMKEGRPSKEHACLEWENMSCEKIIFFSSNHLI